MTESKLLGLLCAFLTGASFTMYNTFFKMIQKLTIPEVILVRAITQTFLIIPILIVLRNDVRGEEGSRLLIWLGALVNLFVVITEFLSVKILPLGDAMAIKFSNPVIVMLLSRCFFKELCSILKILALGLLLIGIFFITNPAGYLSTSPDIGIVKEKKSSSFPLYYGYIAAFSSTTGYAFITLSRKKLSSTTHFSVITFSVSITNVIASSIIIPIVSSYHIPEDCMDIIYAMIIGVFGLAGIIFLMLSLKRLAPGMVSVACSLEIVFAYLVQTVWFGESTDAASLVGAGAVILSVISIAQEENIMELLENCWKPSNNTEITPLIKDHQDDELKTHDDQFTKSISNLTRRNSI